MILGLWGFPLALFQMLEFQEWCMKDLNGFVIQIGWIFMTLASNGCPVCQFLMNDAYFGWHLFVHALHIFLTVGFCGIICIE